MRKRRKAKYTWMPTLGGVTTDGTSSYGTTAFGFVLTPNANGALTSSKVVSLVPDNTFEPDQAQTEQVSLRDFTEGQDWFLKRLVGKIHINTQWQTSPALTAGQSWPQFWVGAAFFVARAQDDNQELPDLTVDEYDPLGSQNVRQPWIWRRTWHLSAAAVSRFTAEQVGQWPSINSFGVSVADGPHIDAKTARRIRREERLWFVASIMGYDHIFGNDETSVTQEDGSQVRFVLDYRVLGQLRKSTNRSTF